MGGVYCGARSFTFSDSTQPTSHLITETATPGVWSLEAPSSSGYTQGSHTVNAVVTLAYAPTASLAFSILVDVQHLCQGSVITATSALQHVNILVGAGNAYRQPFTLQNSVLTTQTDDFCGDYTCSITSGGLPSYITSAFGQDTGSTALAK